MIDNLTLFPDRPIEFLAKGELMAEAKRLEALLRAGEASRADGERLSSVRAALRKLGKIRIGI